MTHVSIIGAGNMGQALAGLITKGGHTVESVNSSDTAKPVTGDIIVLAVPYGAVGDVIARRGEQLAGKIVVDITNPVDFATFDGLTVPADSSAATEIAAALPRSVVLKAFNTNFGGTLVAGTIGGQPTTVLIAGDDADAKALLTGVITDAGLKTVDAGGLKRARELEALAFLQITLAAGEKISWAGGFAVTN
ncbi:NAD(P)-binding domain-containing protein [Actinoplanes sp. NEAU-A12]|uniref:NAD(P)-binding domain-containing protein n=1 Tax=Actinoplanes sandaracinus TaxID=3045177 RepID=A0ABT6WI79_9ACTN|nr:NAD(P)-binding domain-containing protein [Actinoplanes sandaracinus]MDI6099441.1 NAD(P)-binding domain-containing protein [Actinoplanes sandaracinus]